MTNQLSDTIEYDWTHQRWVRQRDQMPLPALPLDPEGRHQDLYFVEHGRPFNLTDFETWGFDHGFILQLDGPSYEPKWLDTTWGVPAINHISSVIGYKRDSAVFFDHTTLWSAMQAFENPVDNRNILNGIHILNLAVLSQAMVLIDHVYAIYPWDVLDLNRETDEDIVVELPMSYEAGWYCYEKLRHIARRFDHLTEERRDWNKYTLAEAEAVLEQWAHVFGDRFVVPDPRSFDASWVSSSLRTPAEDSRRWIDSVRLEEPGETINAFDPYNVMYGTIRAIFNYELSSALDLPYYTGVLNRPVLEYVTRQSVEVGSLCDTLQEFVSHTSHLRQLARSERIFRVPAVFAEIMIDWPDTGMDSRNFLKKVKELRDKYSHLRSDLASYRRAVREHQWEEAQSILTHYSKSTDTTAKRTVEWSKLAIHLLILRQVISEPAAAPWLFGMAVIVALGAPEWVENKLRELFRPSLGLSDSSLSTIEMYALVDKIEKAWRASFSETDQRLFFHLAKNYRDSTLESVRRRNA